ncbi:hypothetical protein CFN16_12240 [Pseudomonas fluorescens]|uniref:Uncharacterized protein n=1 Tax=Pseudomonas fluorescens TaxID=294 RepID=A0A345UWK7_PSEFL|nr:hypothetical protein [Pseudomonas fluorescens]AXJ04859.1 hypothetical protein CFN16_12240 [Pseudomonas fluorescens]
MQLNLLTSPESLSANDLVTLPSAEYQALRQFYESSQALRNGKNETAIAAAIALLNISEQVLYVLSQPAERLRNRVQIIEA